MGPRARCERGVPACGSTVTRSPTPAQRPASAAGSSPACPGVLDRALGIVGGPQPTQCGRAGATDRPGCVGTAGRSGGWQLPSSTKSLMLELRVSSLSTRMLLGRTARRRPGRGRVHRHVVRRVPHAGRPGPSFRLRGQGGEQDRATPPPGLGGREQGRRGHRVALTASGTEHGARAPRCFHQPGAVWACRVTVLRSRGLPSRLVCFA